MSALTELVIRMTTYVSSTFSVAHPLTWACCGAHAHTLTAGRAKQFTVR